MKKAFMIGLIIVVILVVFGAVYLLSSKDTAPASTDNLTSSVSSSSPLIPEETEADLSSLILNLNDFSDFGNWSLKDRNEVAPSDLTNDIKSLGFKGGYHAKFVRQLEGFTIIDTTLLRFSAENITSYFNYSESSGLDLLSDPKVGDKSRAFRTKTVDNNGNELVGYQIEFIKRDIYSYIWIGGDRVDYEILKSLARKAASKI